MLAKSLDVGCGGKIRADIRLELNRTDARNIAASAHYLPFRDQVFDVVLCYHVLEHVKFPKKALRELCRVGKVVKIKLPFLFYHHKQRFDVRSLGLPLRFGLDWERKGHIIRFPFRIECSSTIRAPVEA